MTTTDPPVTGRGVSGRAGPWRVATRRSPLARAQAQQVADALTRLTNRPAELVPMATTGDDHPERAIEAFDVKGLFVDRTRNAVLAGDCDIVVHSHKDLPIGSAPGLVVGAIPARVDPRDALVTSAGHRLATLPRDRTVTIGTSSARRRAQVGRARRDVLVQPIRGNVGTRLRKVHDGAVDGIVVALAGLQRLGGAEVEAWSDLALKVVPLEHGECLHAPAQGALAVECREDDTVTLAALAVLDDADTRACVEAERHLLRELGGGCTAPVGAHASILPGPSGTPRLELLGMLADENGTRMHRASHEGPASEPRLVAATMAASLAAEAPELVDRLGGEEGRRG
ncbi:MAG: hydroxymethylbilane synthase [Nitriliruptorales bacterium]|nr:hydroxymethylbilane synthase [Nitriliruptorales bacterium]